MTAIIVINYLGLVRLFRFENRHVFSSGPDGVNPASSLKPEIFWFGLVPVVYRCSFDSSREKDEKVYNGLVLFLIELIRTTLSGWFQF
jgi:hypothetical protein